MAEYRLDELARISGVSTRNIRAYRERGLLDPPRRVGRSAYYDDYHLSQLRTINQLHRRGFNTAHIAEFFTSLRQGADLADILGIQRAVLGVRSDEREAPGAGSPGSLDVDPDGDEARQLLGYGLAEVVDGALVLSDPAVRAVVARSPDHLAYVRALLQIFEATREAIEGLAGGFVRSLDECVTARFGENYTAKPEEMDELSQIVRDYRDLWTGVVSSHLDQALQRKMAAADSDYTAGILLGGRRDPGARPTTP
ncbi:MerR family transcriptional regulator [Mycolicibacterium flavescens]|uniref:MerR family transcriptional regulator n=1 Tax=Mycolicibacterium flavescens TaxID=1776 RepID=A0A1E3RJ66_MYCFV|nr:MerR family transcriptional regulator [Mycolicibacterium flavescens]MCV7281158.1 MerR family transcriptional regulator [Mycolicibacterium flavescens]ODQ89899.1 MerR family transcriptional regulator [Mycolicibacterium flavescens]